MPIPPAIPFGGLIGLQFLDRTYDRQFATFSKSADIQRDIDHFLDHAGDIRTVDDLMGDRRVLKVVLGAYGLEEDIGKGAFIRKVLEEGTLDPKAFANRLVEPAYKEMAADLGFGDVGGLLFVPSLHAEIAGRYRERQFELSVGEQDIDLRLAMNFRREAAKIVQGSGADRTLWLRLLGSQPLREVLQGALGLPGSFGLIELDQQVEVIAERAEKFFDASSPRALGDREVLDRFVDRFLLNAQITGGVAGSQVRGSTALTLLSSSALGTSASGGLFASNFL